MLEPGDRIPEARVWAEPRGDAVTVGAAIAGPGLALLCFYPWDWSPTCTNELLHLRDRRDDLAAADVRPFLISRDSVWSHAAWVMTLGVEGVAMLSDWEGEAMHGFGVESELFGMTGVSARSAFLIADDTVMAAWMLGNELPDVDAIVAAASSLSR